jgi:hypothetical protein
MGDGGQTKRLFESMRQDEDITMATKTRTIHDVVLDHCKHNHSFQGHIIACGQPEHLIYFLSRLRSKSLKRMRNIVVRESDLLRGTSTIRKEEKKKRCTDSNILLFYCFIVFVFHSRYSTLTNPLGSC